MDDYMGSWTNQQDGDGRQVSPGIASYFGPEDESLGSLLASDATPEMDFLDLQAAQPYAVITHQNLLDMTTAVDSTMYDLEPATSTQ